MGKELKSKFSFEFFTNSCLEIGKLINLKDLTLNNNNLTGEWPIRNDSANCKPAYHMTFSINSCIPVGSIPTEIGGLIKLTTLNLEENQLTGERTINKKIANGRPVYRMTFVMTSCIPVGSIPTEVARLINLTQLDLSGNKLTGKRPISKIFANCRPIYNMRFLMTCSCFV